MRKIVEEAAVHPRAAVGQNPVALLVNVSGEGEVIIVHEAKVQRENGMRMANDAALDEDISREGELLEIVLLPEAIDLLRFLLLLGVMVPGFNFQTGRLSSNGGQKQ
jgi:hypothetical protein